MATKTKPTRVYSYIRFSTEAQGKEGRDSTRRQTEWRDRFMANHPAYVLDDQLKLLDDGRSAYKDEHRGKGGKLGQFLDHVEQGRIPTGSILLVESIDRLTRLEPFTALEMLCFGLIKHGITIQTQIARYDRDAMNNGQIHGLIAEITRAHQESKHKGERVSAARTRAFEAARNSGKKVTVSGPAWLRYNKDTDEFEPIPEAAETIKQIFKMKLDGLSRRSIERKLNEGATWQRPNGWRDGYIKTILNNAAVIGEYQPRRRGPDGRRRPDGGPIDGYYPAIIRREDFHAVKAIFDRNRGKGGRTGAKRNIFTHLAKCGYCGGSLRYVARDKDGKHHRYMVCDDALRRHGCGCTLSVRYAELLDVVLRGCVYLRPEQVLPSSDEHEAKAAALRRQRDGAAAELRGIPGQVENFIDQIGRTKAANLRATYEARIVKLEARATELEATTAEAERELTKLEHGAKSTREWQRGVADLMDAIEDEEAADMRAKLNAHLRNFIERIEIFNHGFPKVADRRRHYHEERGELVPGTRRRKPARRWWDANVDTIAETLAEAYDEMPKPRPTKKRWVEFERYVLDRRMSKKGRFYRVHFKTGERVDLVPPGGLATGFSTVGRVVEKVLPDIERLWQEFERA